MANTNQTETTYVKRHFNVIDAFIIIIVVLCVVGIIFRSQIADWTGLDKQLENYKLSFKISSARYTETKYLQAGNEIFLDSANVTLGTIDGNCTSLPAEIYIEDESGTMQCVNYPQDTFVDVTGTIKCLGLEKEDGFYLSGNYSLAPGMKVSVHTEMLDFEIIITDIVKYGA